MTKSKILAALAIACATAATAETASYPTYLCQTQTDAGPEWDAVMIIDHGKPPVGQPVSCPSVEGMATPSGCKGRGVVTLEDMTTLPADFTPSAVRNVPWRSYNGMAVPDRTHGGLSTMWVDGSGRNVLLAQGNAGWTLVKNIEGGDMTIGLCKGE